MKHPEVFALLFLGTVWSIGSHALPVRAEGSRALHLQRPNHVFVETLETCPTEKMRALRLEMKDTLRSSIRDGVRDPVRSAAQDIRDAIRSLQ